MEFGEADRRYADLKRRYDTGNIGDEEFDAQLEQMMVYADGRWWAKSRETGEWHYDDNGTWVKGTPADYTPPANVHDDGRNFGSGRARESNVGDGEAATGQVNRKQVAWAVFLSGAVPQVLNVVLPQDLLGVVLVGENYFSVALLLLHLVALGFGFWAGRAWRGKHSIGYALLGLLAGLVELILSAAIAVLSAFWVVTALDYLLALLTAILFAAGGYLASSTRGR